jgi:hypothetical protein
MRHKVPPLDSLEYKPSQLGVQAKRLEAQATTLELNAQPLNSLECKLSNLRLKPPP